MTAVVKGQRIDNAYGHRIKTSGYVNKVFLQQEVPRKRQQLTTPPTTRPMAVARKERMGSVPNGRNTQAKNTKHTPMSVHEAICDDTDDRRKVKMPFPCTNL